MVIQYHKCSYFVTAHVGLADFFVHGNVELTDKPPVRKNLRGGG
jgi:hypothetical protein